MNCRTAKERSLARLDASLAAADEVALQAHLASCSRCAAAVREIGIALRWVHELPVEQPAANFDWRLRLRLSQLEQETALERQRGWSERSAWALRFAGSAIAAAVLVLAIGKLSARRMHGFTSGSSAQVQMRPESPYYVPPRSQQPEGQVMPVREQQPEPRFQYLQPLGSDRILPPLLPSAVVPPARWPDSSRSSRTVPRVP